MMELIHGKILPRLDALEAETKKLELKFNTKPQIDIAIEASNVDDLVAAMNKIYSNFTTANLTIKATLKEAAVGDNSQE